MIEIIPIKEYNRRIYNMSDSNKYHLFFRNIRTGEPKQYGYVIIAPGFTAWRKTKQEAELAQYPY